MRRIEASHQLGANRVEFDIQTAADNSLWIMHDGSVDRTTTSTGLIKDKTAAQMQEVRLDDGEPVPTVEEALSYLSSNNMSVVLHAKRLTSTSATRLTNAVNEYAMVGSSTVMGNSGILDKVLYRLRLPSILLTAALTTPASVAKYDSIAILDTKVTTADVAAYHAAGKQYYVYFMNRVDKLADWQRLEGVNGVDNLFTNNSAGFLAYQKAGCS